MTSKNSFAKMILHNITERSAGLLGIFLMFLIALPVHAMVRMDSISRHVESTMTYDERLADAFQGIVGYGNGFVLLGTVIVAFFLGFSGFWFLYSREKTDFYHSLPVRREKLFAVIYTGGFLIYLIPYALNLAMTLLAGAVKGAFTGACLTAAAGSFVTNIVFFLLFYHLAILSVLLTGNFFTGVMGFGCFAMYALIVKEAFIALNERFFHTTILGELNGGVTLSFRGLGFHVGNGSLSLSPVVQYMFTVSGSLENGTMHFNTGSVVLNFVFAVIVGIICVLVYRIRPSESHNKAIAFRKLEPVIKVAVVIPVSILISIYISSNIGSRTFVWFAVALLFSAVVLCAAMDFLYSMDLRLSLRPRISSGVVLAVLVLTTVIFRFDIFRVDTYLPEEDKVEAMSVYINELNGLYGYPADTIYNEGNPGLGYMDNTRYTEFHNIYRMAEMGAAYEKDRENSDSAGDAAGGTFTEELEEVNAVSSDINFYVKYYLKSGREVYRFYSLPKNEELLSCVEKLYDSWDFKENTLPVEFLKGESISGVLLKDIYSYERRVEMSDEDRLDFYNTYKREWESMSFQEIQTKRVVAFLTFSQRMESDGYAYDGYVLSAPVYENFQGTIQLLEKAGYHVYDTEDAKQIQSLTVFVSKPYEDTQDEYTFTEEKDIREILDNSVFEQYSNYLGDVRKDYNRGIEIQWKDGEELSGGVIYLIFGREPECLKNSENTD